MQNKINWENLTKQDAQKIADLLCGKFSVVARCFELDRFYDVSYLHINGPYDDDFNAQEVVL